MLISQIAVFLENRSGRLSAVLKVLAANDINVKSLNIADTNDFGIARMITSDDELAVDVLKAAGFTCSVNKVIAVEVEDRPGELAGTLEALANAGVNVEYIYSHSIGDHKTYILIKPSDISLAQKALEDNNI